MKTLIVLTCYADYHLWFTFFLGVCVASLVAVIAWYRQMAIIRQKTNLEKLVHAIQRYYWLVKNGKSVEANRKALKKIISVFSNRIVDASPSAVEYALKSFKNAIFSPLIVEIRDGYTACKPQFHYDSQQFDNGVFDSTTMQSEFAKKNYITPEDAVTRIENAFQKEFEKTGVM